MRGHKIYVITPDEALFSGEGCGVGGGGGGGLRVGCGKGVVYLVSLGHPTDIGLQLAMQQERVEGNVFISSVS